MRNVSQFSFWDVPYLLKLSSRAFAKLLLKIKKNQVALLRRRRKKMAFWLLSRSYRVFSLSLSLVNSHGGRASRRLCFWVTMRRRGGRLTHFNPRWHPGPMWDLPSVPSPQPTFSCPMPFSLWMGLPFPVPSPLFLEMPSTFPFSHT